MVEYLSNFALVILTAIFVYLALFIIWKHFRQSVARKRALLPTHIWALAVSHLMLVGIGLLNFGNDGVVERIARLVALSLGVFGLVVLIFFQKQHDEPK